VSPDSTYGTDLMLLFNDLGFVVATKERRRCPNPQDPKCLPRRW